MAHFFHALVVVGASLSVAACAGRSDRKGTPAGGAGDGGSAGTAGGSAGTAGGSAGTAGGSAGSAGEPAPGGAAGSAGIPEPGSEAQWNCTDLVGACSGPPPSAWQLLADACPVELDRPRDASDCASDERFTCHLVVTVSDEPLLVNCSCEPVAADCTCVSPFTPRPIEGFCDGASKVCPCAITGILIPK